MAKFGELIDLDIPVLIDFYKVGGDPSMDSILNKVALRIGKKAKVIKIDIDKNRKLSEALKIKNLPTLVIYKNGEMVWRQEGSQEENSLISLLKNYS